MYSGLRVNNLTDNDLSRSTISQPEFNKSKRQNSCLTHLYKQYSKEALKSNPTSGSKRPGLGISASIRMQRSEEKSKTPPKLNLEMPKDEFLKEYEAKLREIKQKYDNKLDYLRQKYSGMTLKSLKMR
mmetsp:Transcript_23578/g.20940  ORF Transcript_23578/g.20940 Transcript_23578/m.20940 type:complete len:128 (+) Transcript_23578:228-611(+)